MSLEFHNPDFWIALFVGLASLALFAWWLRTGGRISR